ncbi:hypothetical protein [Gimesia sp.]|uniref:hypothetical protein n=1 Tax=Gimesia sp. TaxID=2024833 RepID=UPI0025BDC908|nr:hypothetical protein [Gimesia sp.]
MKPIRIPIPENSPLGLFIDESTLAEEIIEAIFIEDGIESLAGGSPKFLAFYFWAPTGLCFWEYEDIISACDSNTHNVCEMQFSIDGEETVLLHPTAHSCVGEFMLMVGEHLLRGAEGGISLDGSWSDSSEWNRDYLSATEFMKQNEDSIRYRLSEIEFSPYAATLVRSILRRERAIVLNNYYDCIDPGSDLPQEISNQETYGIKELREWFGYPDYRILKVYIKESNLFDDVNGEQFNKTEVYNLVRYMQSRRLTGTYKINAEKIIKRFTPE